jgi:hypothetical protein
MTRALLAQANSALAPLAPIFKLLDFAMIVVELVQKIPTVILDPTELLELITKLVQSGSKLISLLPPMTIPTLAVQLLDVLIAYLEGVIAELNALVALQAKIAAAQAQAVQYPQLTIVIDAANANVAVHMDAMSKGLGPVGSLINLANLLMQLVGLPAAPSLTSIGSDPAGALVAMQTSVDALRAVRRAIPL